MAAAPAPARAPAPAPAPARAPAAAPAAAPAREAAPVPALTPAPAAAVSRAAAAPSATGGGFKVGFKVAAKPASRPKAKALVAAIDDDADTPVRKLVKLDYSEGETAEGRLRRLVATVPKDKAQLFAYKLDWNALERGGVVEEKMRPWVAKKVTEYLGSAEAELIDFIVQQLLERAAPEAMVEAVEMILEDEAEAFVVQLRRKLIFEALSLGK